MTAVCTSCHTAHNVLPHTDPRSSIAKQNIAKTCTQCHAQIETVHRQVIRGELWEKQPHLIPACVDCHEPHKIRKVYYTEGMSNGDCLSCHSNPNLKGTVTRTRPGSLYVSAAELAGSRHSRIACVQCHTGGTPSNVRACSTIKDKVDCSICHEKVVGQYRESTHGTLAAQGSPDAPLCQDCHSPHGTLGKLDSASPTYSRNVPSLCAKCHQAGHKAAVRYSGKQDHIVDRYRESIHGKGLLRGRPDRHRQLRRLPHRASRTAQQRSALQREPRQYRRNLRAMPPRHL